MKRTINGLTLTKNANTGVWESLDGAVSITPCHTGNRCSKVAYYHVQVKTSVGVKSTTRRSLTDAAEVATQITANPTATWK